MTKEEIDTMWQQAMQESIKDGEMFTRYHFAEMVTEAERERIKQANAPEIEKINAHIQKAMTALEQVLAEHAMRETQRIGQEIEQEPVAWMSPSWIDPNTRGWQSDSFESIPIEGWLPIYTHPPQRTKQEPCARHCEATAFEIVIKNLRGEIERLKAPQRTEEKNI